MVFAHAHAPLSSQRRVGVEPLEPDGALTSRTPRRRRAARASSSPIAGSDARGAGSCPASPRAQDAWRASTDTILAAWASVAGVMFVAWPLYAATPISSRAAAATRNFAGLVTEFPRS